MLSFKPTSSSEKKLKDLQADLIKNHTQIEEMTVLEREFVARCALVSNVGATTRIENAVLTDPEIDWVDTVLTKDGKRTAFESNKKYIFDKLSKDRERSIEEVVGSREVLNIVYTQSRELKPLTEVSVRGLHQDLLKYYPPATRYMGAYKTSPNRVIAKDHKSGQENIVLEPAEPGVITKTAMMDLLAWYNQTIDEHPWPIAVATEFTFRFLAIHPFQDGNGRIGRALFLLTLLQSNDQYLTETMPFIAIDRHIERNKDRYYDVLYKASNGIYRPDSTDYQYEPLLGFFINVIQKSLKDIKVYRERYANLQKLSESAMLVLQSFKENPKSKIKVAELEKNTSLPRRTIQYALKTLMEKQFISRQGSGAGTRYQLVF